MKQIYDEICHTTARQITKKYSTSFSIAVGLLCKTIRQDVYNVYGFVRVADEIVDTFESFPQEELLNKFEEDLWFALEHGLSANPVINAFQITVNKYDIPHYLICAFMKSMRADLTKKVYTNQEEIAEYIFGSADVVGLMCLKIFVKGDDAKYDRLKAAAIKLGSAFQKVNFLRDMKQDYEDLNRTYFPNIDPSNLTEIGKNQIIDEIKEDFRIAKVGIDQLPNEAKLGVYVAYIYYSHLLNKIVHTPAVALKENRIRVSNPKKLYLFFETYLRYKLNMV